MGSLPLVCAASVASSDSWRCLETAPFPAFSVLKILPRFWLFWSYNSQCTKGLFDHGELIQHMNRGTYSPPPCLQDNRVIFKAIVITKSSFQEDEAFAQGFMEGGEVGVDFRTCRVPN